jgi:UDP-N-acetylglucosamine 2-epimerase
LTELGHVLAETAPHLVLVQGDTASALAGAMAAFYGRIPVAHLEAGLRTHDLAAPFPEEAHRQMIARLAQLHFAPTSSARANLVAEGIDPHSILITGNTVVDALQLLADQIHAAPLPVPVAPDRKLILVTAHRRENLGRPLEAICGAVAELAAMRPELQFVFVTHPNPAAAATTRQMLPGRSGVLLVPPLPYLQALRLVAASWLILTDSGGLQEEAPSFGRPVLVLRERTERTEGVERGVARLVGVDPARIIGEVLSLLDSPSEYTRLTPSVNPYGDGQAANRVVAAIRRRVACSPSASLRHYCTLATIPIRTT